MEANHSLCHIWDSTSSIRALMSSCTSPVSAVEAEATSLAHTCCRLPSFRCASFLLSKAEASAGLEVELLKDYIERLMAASHGCTSLCYIATP